MSDGGRRFVIEFPPQPLMRPHGTVLMIQPFAEEFNLCRRVLAEQARRLSERGWHVVLPELYATGDSDGDESSITIARWRDDLDSLAHYARNQTPGPLIVLAPRLAALMGLDLAIRQPELVQVLLLWQAPESGKQILDPLLKINPIRDEAGAAPTPGAAAADTSMTKVAGVSYSSTFISELAAMSIGEPPAMQISVPLTMQLIQVARNEVALKRGAERLKKIVDGWQAAGCPIGLDSVIAEPYWASMEPTWPEAAFDATERFLDQFLLSRYEAHA